MKVTIEGLPNAGKTTVALLIGETLLQHGFDVSLEDEDGPLTLNWILGQPTRLIALGKVGATEVQISTKTILPE